MIFALDQLLAPITNDFPSGPNLRADAVAGEIYYRMKDARSIARAAERAADAETGQASRPAEWRMLLDLAQDALGRLTKDIEIAAWLAEAALRLHGFAGLRDAFRLIDGLIERYWDALHSVDTETVADKVAPLAGLNGVGQDGTLIQPIRLTPITTPIDGAGLWHFLLARRGGTGSADARGTVEQALRATDSATFVAVARDLRETMEAFALLTGRLESVCGEDAPPSGNIASVLGEAMDVLVEVAGPALTTDAPITTASMPFADAAPAAPADKGTGAAGSREEALRDLTRIAVFFRETEPNSPTAYVIETLIRRARLPLADLVRELIPDETVRQTFLTTAGIWPVKPSGSE